LATVLATSFRSVAAQTASTTPAAGRRTSRRPAGTSTRTSVMSRWCCSCRRRPSGVNRSTRGCADAGSSVRGSRSSRSTPKMACCGIRPGPGIRPPRDPRRPARPARHSV